MAFSDRLQKRGNFLPVFGRKNRGFKWQHNSKYSVFFHPVYTPVFTGQGGLKLGNIRKMPRKFLSFPHCPQFFPQMGAISRRIQNGLHKHFRQPLTFFINLHFLHFDSQKFSVKKFPLDREKFLCAEILSPIGNAIYCVPIKT